jgi:transcriptional regulator with XRE-family HTH domain
MSNRAAWPVHEFKTWRADKGWSLEKTAERLARLGVNLKPRSIQAIEYGFRRPDPPDLFKFERLTGGDVTAEHFATFPLRPRAEAKKPKRKRAA